MADENDTSATLPGAPTLDGAAGDAPPPGAMRALFFVVLMDLLGFGILIPQLPFYGKNFEASAVQVGLIFSLFSICQLIASPILGVISDRYGRRPVLIYSQVGSVVGYVLLGWVAQHHFVNLSLALGLIYLSRIIDGISAGNISTAQAYIGDVTRPEVRSKAMGVLGAAFGIGFTLGPAIGGPLGLLHPSLPAYVAAASSAVAVIMTIMWLPETRVHKPDAASESILHPSQYAFIFRKPILLELNLVWFFSMSAFAMLEGMFALYLSRADTFNFGPNGVSWLFVLAGAVIITVQGFLIGKLTKRYGEWRLAIAGPLLVGCAMMIYASTAWHPVILLLIVAGLFNASGRSLQGPPISTLISKMTSRDQQGVSFGFYNSLGGLARAVGPVTAGFMYQHHPVAPFLTAGIMSVGASIWTWTLRSRATRALGDSPDAPPDPTAAADAEVPLRADGPGPETAAPAMGTPSNS